MNRVRPHIFGESTWRGEGEAALAIIWEAVDADEMDRLDIDGDANAENLPGPILAKEFSYQDNISANLSSSSEVCVASKCSSVPFCRASDKL